MKYIRVELNVFEATLAANTRTVKWRKNMESMVEVCESQLGAKSEGVWGSIKCAERERLDTLENETVRQKPAAMMDKMNNIIMKY